MTRRFFNESSENLIKEYQPYITFIKNKYGNDPFPVFKSIEEFYKDCLFNNIEILQKNSSLNYTKNLSSVVKKLAIEGLLFSHLGKVKATNFYKLKGANDKT